MMANDGEKIRFVENDCSDADEGDEGYELRDEKKMRRSLWLADSESETN